MATEYETPESWHEWIKARIEQGAHRFALGYRRPGRKPAHTMIPGTFPVADYAFAQNDDVIAAELADAAYGAARTHALEESPHAFDYALYAYQDTDDPNAPKQLGEPLAKDGRINVFGGKENPTDPLLSEYRALLTLCKHENTERSRQVLTLSEAFVTQSKATCDLLEAIGVTATKMAESFGAAHDGRAQVADAGARVAEADAEARIGEARAAALGGALNTMVSLPGVGSALEKFLAKLGGTEPPNPDLVTGAIARLFAMRLTDLESSIPSLADLRLATIDGDADAVAAALAGVATEWSDVRGSVEIPPRVAALLDTIARAA